MSPVHWAVSFCYSAASDSLARLESCWQQLAVSALMAGMLVAIIKIPSGCPCLRLCGARPEPACPAACRNQPAGTTGYVLDGQCWPHVNFRLGAWTPNAHNPIPYITFVCLWLLISTVCYDAPTAKKLQGCHLPGHSHSPAP